MALKKSCLFLTFRGATCPGSLFMKSHLFINKELTRNKQGINKDWRSLPKVGIILPFIDQSRVKFPIRISHKNHLYNLPSLSWPKSLVKEEKGSPVLQNSSLNLYVWPRKWLGCGTKWFLHGSCGDHSDRKWNWEVKSNLNSSVHKELTLWFSVSGYYSISCLGGRDKLQIL